MLIWGEEIGHLKDVTATVYVSADSPVYWFFPEDFLPEPVQAEGAD